MIVIMIDEKTAKNVLVKPAFELQSSHVFQKRSKGYREKSSAEGNRSRVLARLNLLATQKEQLAHR